MKDLPANARTRWLQDEGEMKYIYITHFKALAEHYIKTFQSFYSQQLRVLAKKTRTSIPNPFNITTILKITRQ